MTMLPVLIVKAVQCLRSVTVLRTIGSTNFESYLILKKARAAGRNAANPYCS